MALLQHACAKVKSGRVNKLMFWYYNATGAHFTVYCIPGSKIPSQQNTIILT